VALSRFYEALRAGAWSEAERAYDDLEHEFPDVKDDTAILTRLAEVQEAQGGSRRILARATLSRVLDRDPSHLAALLRVARLEADSGDPVLRQSAKEHLLQGARNGLPVLREIAGKDARGLAQFRDDPRFILAVLRAPLVRADASKVRDPFAPPVRWLGAASARDESRSREAQVRAIVARVERLFEEVEGMKDPRDLDAVIARLADLDAALAALREHSSLPSVLEQLERYERRLVVSKQIPLELKLAAALVEGARLCDGMDRSLAAEDWDAVSRQAADLRALVERLRREGVPELDRAADALAARGRAAEAEADKRRRIAQLRLLVTGIVVDPRPHSKDRAIVNDRIYEVGDRVVDASDREIPGLTLVAIREGVVRFSLDGAEFVRALEATH
jgi:hypothetical protein